MIQKKICLLGGSSVGKTSLVRQFVQGIFDDKYLTTIGVKVDKKIVEVENKQVQFLLWDIEGVDQYAHFQQRYLRGASAVIIVIDQTRPQSLLDAFEIFNQVQQSSNCPAILALNKSDLVAGIDINQAQFQQFQAQFELVFQTSAKTGAQVENLFNDLATLLITETSNG
ncbi:Rab family GTPase [Catenovulum adriaticum]|uniref:GTP-binding protein n=1 Tax=Catenovulum adriaticum TaxID=2984846 RepID=A0ABY7AI90_9ALTE|nr:Rab family GTPase [Catenovulum sp. TS8]WAJ69174.1 GTP-binding protein [Catenovulum sp. TS8]